MKQRVVALVAQYLEHRVRGQIVRVRPVHSRSGSSDLHLSSLRPAQSAESERDDYLVAIRDVRDGRTHLLHSVDDLREWLVTFKTGECLRPTAAICSVCDRLHSDRGPDGELTEHCVTCQLELIDIFIDLDSRRDAG